MRCASSCRRSAPTPSPSARRARRCSSAMILLAGATIVLPDRVLERASLLIDGDRIAAIEPRVIAGVDRRHAHRRDGRCTIVPGFVDVPRARRRRPRCARRPAAPSRGGGAAAAVRSHRVLPDVNRLQLRRRSSGCSSRRRPRRSPRPRLGRRVRARDAARISRATSSTLTTTARSRSSVCGRRGGHRSADGAFTGREIVDAIERASARGRHRHGRA